MDYEQLYNHKNDIYYGHQRSEILPYLPANFKTVLDIGCGNGAFGALLKKEFDCSVWGIEPNKAASVEAGEKLDNVINGLFCHDLPDLTGKRFDTIFFNDVLEHLADPEEVLTSCRGLLNKGGCIIASIPNVRWYPVILSLLRYKDFKYENAGVMDKTHLRFFTSKSIIRLFESSGYRILKLEGINKSSGFRVFNLLNFLLFNTQADMKYPQFVVVAANQTDAN